MAQIDIASIGTLAVDYFGIVPTIPKADEKVMADAYEIHPGGVAGNVITQVARLGVNAGWIGKMGDDPAGKILLDEFRHDGVHADHAEIVPGKHSMFTWIMVDKKGERCITMFPNVLTEFTRDDVDKKHAPFISSLKILMAEACVLPLPPIIRAMEIAREAGVTVMFDLDVRPSAIESSGMGTNKDLDRALSLTDVFIPGKAAAMELLGTKDLKASAKKLLGWGAHTAAVTLGAAGCLVCTKDDYFEVPGFSVPVVDTTGAGDAFHGGFAYGLLKGLSLRDTALFANACGAFCCQGIGARSTGTLADINRLIATQAK